MTDAYRSILAVARRAGLNVFLIPADKIRGSAFRASDGRGYINIFCNDGMGVISAHILAHEVGHRALGHTARRTSVPTWVEEYQAEQFVINILGHFCTHEEIAQVEEWARDHIRPMVQRFLDAGIFHHGEIDAGIWAGCHIPGDWGEYSA